MCITIFFHNTVLVVENKWQILKTEKTELVEKQTNKQGIFLPVNQQSTVVTNLVYTFMTKKEGNS